jgi:4-diphosphocytidyl-2-C-methyl-D-erythritol kinase
VKISAMVFFPNAKINLGLFVTGKRSDGYHNIQSILYPIPLKDAIEVIDSPDGKFQFSTSGIRIEGPQNQNLVVIAWQMLQHDFNLAPVHIHLHKSIPMGAGLGGGSADAAFIVRLIDQHFNLQLTVDQMKSYAGKLGMDCPFFIENRPALATQRGDRLKNIDIDLSGKFLVIVKPECHISTREAYAGIKLSEPDIQLQEVIKQPVPAWKNLVKNDFEETVFKTCPMIKNIKEEIYNCGATFALMSGSGSAVYALFNDEVGLKTQFPKEFYFSCWL